MAHGIEGKLPIFSFISKRMTPSFSRWNSFYFHDVTPELSTESWNFIKPEKTANYNQSASDGDDLTQMEIISEIHYPLNMKSEHSALVVLHPIHSIWHDLTWFQFCTMVNDISLTSWSNYSKTWFIVIRWSGKFCQIYTGPLCFTVQPTGSTQHQFREFKKQKAIKKCYLQGKFIKQTFKTARAQHAPLCLFL